MIVRVSVVLKRTVVGDWRFDYLCDSHLQSQVSQVSVDDVMKSGLLNVIGLFSRDVIGWKTRIEFVNSHWSVSNRLLFVGLFVGLFTWLMSRL